MAGGQDGESLSAAERVEHGRARQWRHVHECIGHAGQRATDQAMRSGRFGRPTTPPHPKHKRCDVCLQAKGTAARLSAAPRPRQSRAGVMFHADVGFPPQGASRDWWTSFTVFICDATGFIVLHAQKNKSGAVDGLRRLREFVAAESRMNPGRVGELLVLHSDQGGEFTSSKWGASEAPFGRYLRKHGVRHTVSTSGVPEHNGVAERANRTVKERMAAVWLASGLGDECWDMAARYAVHAINQDMRGSRPSRAQQFLGQVDHRVAISFGAHGFMRTRKGRSRAVHARFLGYSDVVRDGYVLLMDDVRIMRSKDSAVGSVDDVDGKARAGVEGEDEPGDGAGGVGCTRTVDVGARDPSSDAVQ